MSKKDVMMPLRELPQSIAAEAAVLGSIILDPACLAEVTELLCVEAFYYFENRSIYEALLRISNRGDGKSIDCVLLRDELVTMGRMEDVGVEYIAEVMDSIPSAANAIYYAKIVREKYLLRKLIAAGSDICDRAFEQGETVDELIDMAEASIFAIGRQTQASTMHELSELLPLAFRAIEMRDPNSLTGLSTGFYQLDEITSGLQKGDVIVMAARPSISKTLLAKELDVPVILLSQLNRASASRSNFMPRLTDLRESGSIEQNADVVLLLHWEGYYHKGQADYCNTNVADIIIAKQRNGPIGAIKLTFRPELSRFESYTPPEQ